MLSLSINLHCLEYVFSLRSALRSTVTIKKGIHC